MKKGPGFAFLFHRMKHQSHLVAMEKNEKVGLCAARRACKPQSEENYWAVNYITVNFLCVMERDMIFILCLKQHGAVNEAKLLNPTELSSEVSTFVSVAGRKLYSRFL